MDNQLVLKQLHEQRRALITQLEAINNAIIGFGGSIELSINIPDIYPDNGTYEEKILYVLSIEEKPISAIDIGTFIVKYEDIQEEITVLKICNNITMIASSMYKAGKIKAKKTESNKLKNIYYL